MVVKAANHRVVSRVGRARLLPSRKNSHNGVADTDPQVAYDRCQDGQCRVDPANKARLGGNPLHAYHASLDTRLIAFRLGRSLALPTYGFAHARTLPMWHRNVSVSQLRTVV